ncbi:MAG: sulfite exporter TauE/SafE family protein [Pseudomonadales bacterium]|nr:sulfite exporter TauE/SafE family protein [Pseudomonadales bacterium]NRA16130.1 sulfite exporter TauE/SafE family protein [Oceanospirillaceae bacterium]
MLWAALILVTFFAATVQSALGFGFGLIAVATFLILLNSADAVQLVIILTFIMSAAQYPSLKSATYYPLLKMLALSALLGFPIGIWLYQSIDLSLLKQSIGVLLIALAAHSFYRLNKTAGTAPKPTRECLTVTDRHWIRPIGLLAGIMATSLAMPGPIVMLYLNSTALQKNQIRAIMSGFFIFSYLGALIFQLLLVGISTDTWLTAFLLLPAALLGTVAGHYLSGRIAQHFFRKLVLAILLLTGIFILINQ